MTDLPEVSFTDLPPSLRTDMAGTLRMPWMRPCSFGVRVDVPEPDAPALRLPFPAAVARVAGSAAWSDSLTPVLVPVPGPSIILPCRIGPCPFIDSLPCLRFRTPAAVAFSPRSIGVWGREALSGELVALQGSAMDCSMFHGLAPPRGEEGAERRP